MKKICFNGLKKVLSEKEMKNVLGGSDTPCSECSGDAYTCWCNGVNIGKAASELCCAGYCSGQCK